MSQKNQISILVAEDDLEDCQMIDEVIRENHLLNELRFVNNGEELLDYLYNFGKYKDKDKYPLPSLILLDLNMPRKDGREALKEIKRDPKLCQIPIIILTTSSAESDILQVYNLGANSFISKPVTVTEFVKVIKELGRYWFEIVELPQSRKKEWE